METPALSSAMSPAELGLVCPACGAAEFRACWQAVQGGGRMVRMTCARCGRFLMHLPQQPDGQPLYVVERGLTEPGHPAGKAPGPGSRWVGFVRQGDGVWRAVAEAPTLGRCWDALLHFPGDGDRLCVPTRGEHTRRPGRVPGGEPEHRPQPDEAP